MRLSVRWKKLALRLCTKSAILGLGVCVHLLNSFCAILKVESMLLMSRVSLKPSFLPATMSLNWFRISIKELLMGVAESIKTFTSSFLANIFSTKNLYRFDLSFLKLWLSSITNSFGFWLVKKTSALSLWYFSINPSDISLWNRIKYSNSSFSNLEFWYFLYFSQLYCSFLGQTNITSRPCSS